MVEHCDTCHLLLKNCPQLHQDHGHLHSLSACVSDERVLMQWKPFKHSTAELSMRQASASVSALALAAVCAASRPNMELLSGDRSPVDVPVFGARPGRLPRPASLSVARFERTLDSL